MSAERTTSRRITLRGALKILALLVVVAFIAWYVVGHWGDVVPVLGRLSWWQCVLALVSLGGGLIASMFSWRSLLASMGTLLPAPAAARVFFLGQLGKYVPGSVWPILAQAELAKEYGAPRARSGIALLVQMVVSTVVGIVFAAACLAASSPAALWRYWWLLLIALIGVICLAPPLFSRVMRVAGRLLRRPTEDVAALSWSALGRASAWNLLMWAFFGTHLWLLALNVGGAGLSALLTAAGGYALAWLVGFVIVFLPAGAGAREAALALALAPIMHAPTAIGLALASRFLTLIADAISAGVAVLGERLHARRSLRSSGQADSVDRG